MKKLSTVVLTAIIGAASASAQYALPAGAFYRGWIAGAGNYGKPESGLSIRRDTFANGTTKAVKVIVR